MQLALTRIDGLAGNLAEKPQTNQMMLYFARALTLTALMTSYFLVMGEIGEP